MKNKSFMLCIAGILLITIMGVYMYLKDSDALHSMSNINNNYEIQFVDNYVLPNVDISDDKFIALVPYIEYEQLEESELEEKINATFRDASTNWITDEVVNAYENVLHPQVYCHTRNYLSIGQFYETKESGHSHYIEDYITVDMETGNQVFLDDILDVDRLCSFLIEGQQYSASRYAFSLEQKDADEGIRAAIKGYSKDGLKKMLKQCSMKQKEFYNWVRESQQGKYPSLQQRANFYLQNSQLVIVLEDEFHPKVIIKYKDLDGILKEDFKKKMLD